MNKEVKERWVEALRSGEYRQGRGSLRQEHPDEGDLYCCLGVLCDIVMPEGWSRAYGRYGHGKSGTVGGPDTFVREKAGIAQEVTDTLIELNDDDRKSFGEIAAWIEENL